MKNIRPTVSIIMPAYNCEDTLDSAVESVIEQSWKDWELLIVVDAATDSTLEKSLYWQSEDARIRVLENKENQKVAKTRNTGLAEASGRYIAFIDSDDRWFSCKLEKQISFMETSDVKICYTAYRRINDNGRILSNVCPKRKVNYRDMLKTNSIGNSTAVYDRSKLGHIRFEDIGHEDYLFWLTAVHLAGEAHRIPDPFPMMDYLVSEGSLSSNKKKAAQWQWAIYRKHLSLPIWSAFWYFALYSFFAIRKRVW